MHFTSIVIAAGLTVSSVAAHPGPHAAISGSDLARRSVMSKRCAESAGLMHKKRNEKRVAKRALELEARNATFEITTESPYYETIQNDTCVLTPEVTAGPYVWPRSQTLRQDMTEDQSGVPLWMDIGVMDMATCEPLENALVDFWHCNATGSYSSFTKLSPNTAFETLLTELGLNTSTYELGTTDLHTDDTTFLRGMWPTDSDGMMEMKTIFPGFYIQRAIHIHAEVHLNWTLRENGTLISDSRVSTGQLYFNESVSEQIMALEPYASHTEINRTTTAEDSIFTESTVGGYSPVFDVVAADGVDIANGVIAYITIGVDTTAIETSYLSGAPS